ncbi:MAG: helix-turn-helix transcriptional regulator [Calditrichaeota bacterium]|nr:helix-turn-helix transcriptional regulator [Calditrichota bacterium]HQU71393.1 AraC family transcriptional regulator [Calditrichia bacterium]
MIAPFQIFKVTPEKVREISESANQPHRHDYEELLVGIEGTLEHFIDFSTSKMDAPFVSFVTKGKVHQVTPRMKDGKCDIWVIRFRSEFIPGTIFQLYACFHDNANLSLPSERCFKRFVTLCELMYDEAQQPAPDYAILRHLLSALFTMFESERRKLPGNDNALQSTQNTTFVNFLKILEENFHRSLSVEFYAEKLFMSSRNLNLICQNILQQSVSEIIETRKLIEAKNLLSATDLSVAEIGFELGYNEKSYFSNVFKKKSGLTPTEFRREMRKIVS